MNYIPPVTHVPSQPSIADALVLQSTQCRVLGSAQYADLLEGLTEDFEAGGLVFDVLGRRTERPVHDALPLRLLGAVHRIALSGRAPELARRLPSCGGDGSRIDVREWLSIVARNRAEIDRALGEQVQTNEVGRSVVLRELASWLPSVGVTEFDLLEIGSSAGLNLNFDRLGEMSLGAARCVERRGSDPSSLDVSRDDDALRLQSFVWPDQLERLDRLRRAIDVALQYPPHVEHASADEFLRTRLCHEAERSTVVFHSIVWQYLPNDVRDGVRSAIDEAGSARDSSRPVVWARMEPSGPVADVRVTVVDENGRREHRLAEVGYHGQDFRWLD